MSRTNKKRQVARSPEDLAAKKNLILDAAMRLLVDRGYTQTTMSDVAREAGIGRGTVYWHFVGKDDLFFSAIVREVERIDVAMRAQFDASGSALASIDAMIRTSFAYYQQAAPFFQALLSIIGGADEALERRMVALMSDLYGQYNQLFTDLLVRAKAEGDVRQDVDAEVTAAAITVLLDAMYLQIGLGLIPTDEDRLSAAITSLIHRGCVPPEADHA